jgi:hypothetical protein
MSILALLLAARGTITIDGAVVAPMVQTQAQVTQQVVTTADPHLAPFLSYYGQDSVTVITYNYQ